VELSEKSKQMQKNVEKYKKLKNVKTWKNFLKRLKT